LAVVDRIGRHLGRHQSQRIATTSCSTGPPIAPPSSNDRAAASGFDSAAPDDRPAGTDDDQPAARAESAARRDRIAPGPAADSAPGIDAKHRAADNKQSPGLNSGPVDRDDADPGTLGGPLLANSRTGRRRPLCT
jgi:hypothetical protein